MKKIFAIVLFGSMFLAANSQWVVSRTLLHHYTKPQLDSILNANGIPTAFVNTIYDVDVYKVIYNTVSYDSSATTASGLMVVPTNLPCKVPLVSYQHGTIIKKDEAPSYFVGSEPLIATILASTGYVALEPDYIGLGDGPGKHIYQQAQSEATAVIDMIRAGREVCDSVGQKLNGQVFLTGYSQGGHATMAAHKMIQEKLDNEMHVVASAPMSGAYSMSQVMVNVMLSDSVYPSPSYLGYIITSWNLAYQMYDTLAKPLIAPYDSLLPIWFDGNHGTGYVDGHMPSVPKLIFKPDTVTAFQTDPNHTFRLRLQDNDVDNWLPTSPVKMIYCAADKFVSDSNTMVAYSKMKALGCTQCDTLDVNPTLNHVECATFAILAAKTFIDSFALTDCSNSVSDLALSDLTIYPNPTAETVFIRNLPATVTEMRLYSADGKLIKLMPVSSRIDIADLSAGTYLLRVEAGPAGSKTLLLVKQ